MIRITPFLLIIAFIITSCKEKGPAATDTPTGNRVETLLSQMSLDEKIGQMTQAEANQLKDKNDIKTYALGSLLTGGGSVPGVNTVEGWANAYDMLQEIALQSRLKIPMLYGIDAVHGHNNVYGATIFPHNIGVGCSRDASLAERTAKATAEEVAATGIDWTFAPCIAVPQDERWGRTYEGFGETVELQKLFAAAQVKGFQGSSLKDNTSILACAKHFVGDGATNEGKDQGDVLLDEIAIRLKHLPGYQEAINNNVASVMVSYSSINGAKMHGSKYWLTNVLKQEMGFKGIVISDWNGVDQIIPGNYKMSIAYAINAGIDMVMVPGEYRTFISHLKQLVNEGTVPMSRIDDAVRRILTVKENMGLFEKPYADRTLIAKFASAEHKQLAREAVRKSLVLLKNANNTLPLKKNISKLMVMGRHANSIGLQCGGWTISWQGLNYNSTPGTTILQGIKNTVSSSTQVIYSETGTATDQVDAVIVVIGEEPYAEGAGDRSNLTLDGDNSLLLDKARQKGVPVIAVLISGRPMVLSNFNYANAWVAAWLPGTEGQGIADVLFGDYNFSGKLSHSWPETMSSIPVNYGQANYSPLFPYGYGLTY